MQRVEVCKFRNGNLVTSGFGTEYLETRQRSYLSALYSVTGVVGY
jgi:hypothetical protein